MPADRNTRESLFQFRDHWLSFVRVARWVWPGWWFYKWFVGRWIVHDCDRQPLTCRCEFLLRWDWWLDV